MISVGEALTRGTKAIDGYRISQTPLLDASLLLCKTTGLSREQLYSKSDSLLSDSAESLYVSLIKRRCEHEPIAYLIGEREFFGRTFTVTPDVLIPRSDTEILVETALELVKEKPAQRILDLCTGSGCIGISLAAELPDSEVTLADISEGALQVATENAQRLLNRPVTILQSDLFSACTDTYFSLIATNPPYLTQSWFDQTEAQVKAEPALALLGGDADGLAIIRSIIDQAPKHLHPRGILLIECDFRQQGAVMDLLSERGFSHIESKKDLAQLHRVVWGVLDV